MTWNRWFFVLFLAIKKNYLSEVSCLESWAKNSIVRAHVWKNKMNYWIFQCGVLSNILLQFEAQNGKMCIHYWWSLSILNKMSMSQKNTIIGKAYAFEGSLAIKVVRKFSRKIGKPHSSILENRKIIYEENLLWNLGMLLIFNLSHRTSSTMHNWRWLCVVNDGMDHY